MLVDSQGEEQVTYFEALSALAYLWFADKPVALGVFEVGMGGTWDATNLVRGDVAVLTPIALDHPELGSTIARGGGREGGHHQGGRRRGEPRAGPRCPARDRGAMRGGRRATLLLEYRDFEVEDRLQATGGQALRIRGSRATYDELFLPMFGEHAAQNAAAAIVALEALIDKALDPDVTREALADVRWPGRMEIVGRHPTILLDGAHNPAGAEALAVALREAFIWDRLHLVISISANKDVAGIVRPLAPLADIAYVGNEHQRTLRRRRC